MENPGTTVYEAFSEVAWAFRTAVAEHDLARLDDLLHFGAWAMQQRAEHVWNSAAVVFLEHVFDEPGAFELVAPRLPSKVTREVWTLWEGRLTPDQLKEVRGRAGDHGVRRLSRK